jgi:hypothetical protein
MTASCAVYVLVVNSESTASFRGCAPDGQTILRVALRLSPRNGSSAHAVNRKSASRNSKSTLSHRHPSSNPVHPSSWVCAGDREEEEEEVEVVEMVEVMVVLVVLVCICDFQHSVTPHPANFLEPRSPAAAARPVLCFSISHSGNLPGTGPSAL